MVKLSILTISDIVDSIKKSYDVRNLKELCRDLSIILMYSGMGKTENACKGFFLTHSKIKTITINTDLPELIQNIVLAHELGHAILHKNATIYSMSFNYLMKYQLWNMKRIFLLLKCF